jgi:hypothetical protein
LISSLFDVQAQRGGRGRDRFGGGGYGGGIYGDYESGDTIPGDGLDWEIPEEDQADAFTFVRVKYDSYRGGRGGGWRTDIGDAELIFAHRLHQLTSLKVNSYTKVFRLDDPRILEYPFIYIVEPGGLVFRQSEREALRKYLLNGGFLMVDDFWGEAEYENWDREFRLVFPEEKYRPKDLTLEHEIFSMVFPLNKTLDKLPQIPNIRTGHNSQFDGVTWERYDAQTPHYRAVFDDNGRIMALICHNTDLGDGWEQEGASEYYFKEFSEKKAFPLGINIVFYALTH